MTPGDLQRVIGALDVAPLGAAPERGFRPSLAGDSPLGRPSARWKSLVSAPSR